MNLWHHGAGLPEGKLTLYNGLCQDWTENNLEKVKACDNVWLPCELALRELVGWASQKLLPLLRCGAVVCSLAPLLAGSRQGGCFIFGRGVHTLRGGGHTD
eukprot:gene11852-biopygen4752